MKRNILTYSLLASMAAVPAMAQETYESANIATQDLNGTARYVGMGGAMEALGADLSTMSSNPATIGMFRHSTVNGTIGLVSTKGNSEGVANEFNAMRNGFSWQNSKTSMSFDQIGFVVTTKTSNDNYINFGFNYHKGRNFNQILSLTGNLGGASQNRLAYMKGEIGSSTGGGYDIACNNKGEYMGYDNATSGYDSRNFSQMDYLTWNAFTVNAEDGNYYCYNGDGFLFNRNSWGYIANYDFNISGNWNDRVYWGVTFGVKDVHYSHDQAYREFLVDVNGNSAGNTTTVDSRDVTGHGFDISAGVIIRPIEESPFRIGLSITTPTWYELESSNTTTFYNNGTDPTYGAIGSYDHGKSGESYKYKMYTPWKFAGSLGYTFGQFAAVGFSYEYADYSSIDNRNITSEDYYYDDYYGDGYYQSNSASDDYMNSNTKSSLKGVSTFKLGAEFKVLPQLALRVGYNHVTPMYNDNGYRSTMLNADGCYYMSTTDYVNWKATNRITAGLGYTLDHFTIDLAYQYSTQKGDFHPFESYTYNGDGNVAPTTEVKNNRHQMLLTLGYHF